MGEEKGTISELMIMRPKSRGIQIIHTRPFRYSPGKRRAAPAKPVKLEDRRARETELNFMVVVLVVADPDGMGDHAFEFVLVRSRHVAAALLPMLLLRMPHWRQCHFKILQQFQVL